MALNFSTLECTVMPRKDGPAIQTRSSQTSEDNDCGESLETFLRGNSLGMRAVEEVIRELSQSDVTVLVLGEAGSGKKTVARQIHEASRRSRGEFRAISCKNLSSETFEKSKASLLSCPGTIYLDEVAELSSATQFCLFETLLELEHGGRENLPARLICGSGHNLDVEAGSRQFLEDLYYLINGVCLRLPPLRQRKQDIRLFTDFFLVKFAGEFGRPAPMLSERTRQLFMDYDWPGNVKELADAAKAIVVLGNESLAMGGLRAILSKPDRHHRGQQVSLRRATRAAAREAEKELILSTLSHTRWNRRRAAEELQISYKALLYKLKQIGYTQSEAS